MTLSDQIRRLRIFLSDPEKWTQRAEARDFLQCPIDPESEDAVCFCLRGATRRLFPPEWHYRIRMALTDTLRERGLWPDIPVFNDAKETTHRVILGAIDETVERVSSDEEFQQAMAR